MERYPLQRIMRLLKTIYSISNLSTEKHRLRENFISYLCTPKYNFVIIMVIYFLFFFCFVFFKSLKLTISFSLYNSEKIYFLSRLIIVIPTLCSRNGKGVSILPSCSAYLQSIVFFLDLKRNMPCLSLLFWLLVGFLLQLEFPHEPPASVFPQASREISIGSL